jgi:hypothetical protein
VEDWNGLSDESSSGWNGTDRWQEKGVDAKGEWEHDRRKEKMVGRKPNGYAIDHR